MFRFFKDSHSVTYERSVYAVLDFFGDIGGLNEILKVTGGMIVGLFSQRLLMYSLLKRLYQVDMTDKGKFQVDLNQPIIADQANIRISDDVRHHSLIEEVKQMSDCKLIYFIQNNYYSDY